MKNSKFLKFNGEDIKKAIVLGAGVLASGEAVTATDVIAPQDGHTNSIIYAVVTMVVYLLKNWLTNGRGDMFKKDVEG